jgi:hypothetical protein
MIAVLALMAVLSFGTDGQTGWVSASLAPSSHVALDCPPGYEPIGSDAATVRPYRLTRRVWLDGGEVEAWLLHGRVVATARPAQDRRGLGHLEFRSYAQPVSVEIICGTG